MGKKVARRKTEKVTTEKISRTNKSTSEDEVVGEDDLAERYSGERIQSRSSPSYFSSVMRELKPILGERQKTRISKTPFTKWVDMPVLALSTGRVDYFLSRFNASSCSFVVAPDVIIPFRSSDFSVVLGLRHSGRPIDFTLKKHSSFLSRHFSGNVSNAIRSKIRQKMRLLARSDSEGEVDDFIRLFILLIFSCVIFPTGNCVIPSFIFPYLDDLSTFFDCAWGDAAFRFLHREICDLGRKFYMDGCVLGLMALVYESLPTLAIDRGINVFPRLFRWAKSNIPLNSVKAEPLLKSIDSTQVQSMQPSRKEEELLVPKPGFVSNEETSKIQRLENAMTRQMDEIKALKRKCAELEEWFVRSGADEKVVVVDRARTRAERASQRRWSVVVDPPPKSKREVKLKTQSFVDVDQDSSIPVAPPTSRTQPFVDVDQGSRILVDPPTSRPKSKREVKTQIFIDLDPDSVTIVDVDHDSTPPEKGNTDEFKGRVDFTGHKNASDVDRKLVIDFLAKEEPEENVWDDDYIGLSRQTFCNFSV